MSKLKYYIVIEGDEREISSKEYVDTLVDEAYRHGITYTAALQVVRENRQEAREHGHNAWYCAFMGRTFLEIRDEATIHRLFPNLKL